ncbi:Por secretion system C-terminal sorting domain-containing protein [Hymenobacter daecheongensis DSM 21074]|uniref:Por secretion system C-terminal sorting domain-containing protein n=1 Tax=Hymenobacter daecheongensis DSM 21074 TaxID=1121955 RepID=A0A1M6GE63_9BACT|nr:T9SS type A sorting domain-containing protein [Hymenobacter daecheongensis]SHJ08204.1 Por secretion system C-terminal sorting domain-containing protein [Hymenobacter daecheongensis DSM 21074]
MKHFLPLTLTAALLTAALSGTAQSHKPAHATKALFDQAHHHAGSGLEQAARAAGIASVTVPGRSIEYYWDLASARWGGATTLTNTYNVQGRVTQIISTDSATNTPYGKTLLTYNTQGLVTEELEQNWNGSAYVNSYRIQQAYDANGRETLYLDQEWRNNAWLTRYGYRSTRTYNPAGAILTEVSETLNTTTSIWEPDYRTTYTVNASNQWTEFTGQEWDNGVYVNDYRVRNVVWYNWAKLLPAYYEQQQWDPATSTWGEDYRTTFTYQPNGSYVSIGQELVAPNVWLNDDRHTYTYDNLGNEILHQGEIWTNNAWVIDHASRALLSYTAGNQVRRRVEQEYDTQRNAYVNDRLTTYSNFITLATRRATELEAAAALYPNPTLSAATLSIAGLREQGTVRTEVLNTLGQVVQTLTLQPRQGTIRHELNLSALPAGLYTVRLHAAEGTIAKRVVKN